MKRHTRMLLVVCALLTGLTSYAQRSKPAPSDTKTTQMEKLDRGAVLIKRPGTSTTAYFLSWRMLGSDDENTTFTLLRSGQKYANGKVYTNTTGVNVTCNSGQYFQIVTLKNGEPVETSDPIYPWGKSLLEIPLEKPVGSNCTYSANDCSVGDVDGDGQYEIILKWDPSNSQDNSNNGVTGNVFIDCYKLNGTRLWRIDLGVNIRAGAHYTQFMVYDFDKDGKAEMICKTAPGSKDGAGNYVNLAATLDAIKNADNSKSWRNSSSGRINGGQEYLTVFNGETGSAIHTIAYYPNRNAKAELSEAAGTFNWDDRSGKSDKGDYGNRGERHLAAVAYLDGADKNPSVIMCRGYYTYAYLWAVDFDGTQLKHRWLHRSDSKTQYSVVDANMVESEKITAPQSTAKRGSYTMYGNGNHNISVADVDGDGKDEILWGSAACDDDGKLLYAVGYGHGDAIHLGDLDPDRPGLELFDIHEDEQPQSWDIHDAATGALLQKGGQSGIDNGRGCAADIVADTRGYEFWSAYGGYNSEARVQLPFNAVTGEQAGSVQPSMNFRIYWDADVQDELLDGIAIYKYPNMSTTLRVGITAISGQSNNGTKSTPCLSADIFGDWREELIVRNTDDDALLIYSTIEPSTYRVPTLMHDHVYRMGICWQNVAYNQPPHLGYYLPDYVESFQGKETTGIQEIETSDEEVAGRIYNLQGIPVEKPTKGIYLMNGKKAYIK